MLTFADYLDKHFFLQYTILIVGSVSTVTRNTTGICGVVCGLCTGGCFTEQEGIFANLSFPQKRGGGLVVCLIENWGGGANADVWC